MKGSRRNFLKETMVAGAGLGMLGTSAGGNAQSTREKAILTPQVKAFMEVFGLRYPIFAGPYGGPALASAISNAGAMGTIALWGHTPDAARDSVARLRSQTKRPFAVNYVLAFEPRSL